jgi:benzyl alcohol O-benzoyltransferase
MMALWRARTTMLELPPDEEVRLPAIVNFRKLPDLALPVGYYGNTIAFSTVLVAAGALLAGSLVDKVELVWNANDMVSAEYVRSMVDFLMLRGRPCLALMNALLMSDLWHADFGWGLGALYNGPVEAPPYGSYLIDIKNCRGEEAVAMPIALPRRAMDRFAFEVVR